MSRQNRSTSRRTFLATSGALLTAGLKSPLLLSDEKLNATAAELIAGKDKRMQVLKPFPAVMETPLPLLAKHRVTPAELLFVRNNQQPETAGTLKPNTDGNWTVKFTGGLNKTASVTLADLQKMDMVEHEMVLQCSGNGRSLYSRAAQTSGTQWGKGGVGNVKFRGVPVSAVIAKLGLDPTKSVSYVTASGADDPLPGKEDFMHSLPVNDVVNRSLLALEMNGSPLPAIHGGPVRLITPGVYATMNLKWLSQLDFVDVESSNYNHVPRYRVPGTQIEPGADFDFTLENSRFNWNMKVKSIVLTPGEGAQLKAGPNTITGVAFNDGGARIEDVYVSINAGESWERATLVSPEGLYGWTQFSLATKLPAGRHEIQTRAIDAYGRTQPLNGSLTWNPRGYEWNGIEVVTVDVS